MRKNRRRTDFPIAWPTQNSPAILRYDAYRALAIPSVSTASRTPHSGSSRCLQSRKRHACSANSGNAARSSWAVTAPNPTSRIPGVSIMRAPLRNSCKRAEVVVCLPFPLPSLTCPVRARRSSASAFSSELFPTPLWPARTARLPASSSRNSSIPVHPRIAAQVDLRDAQNWLNAPSRRGNQISIHQS